MDLTLNWICRGLRDFSSDIPESVADSIRLPLPEVEPRLFTELAVALYAQGILSFGKAAELAKISRYAFADIVGGRNIPRHYTAVELAEDFDYARGDLETSPFR